MTSEYQTVTPEFLTVEQLAERLQVSRATLFMWMQKGFLASGRHYFKRGRVLRFIWSHELIQELLTGSPVGEGNASPVKPLATTVTRKKSSPVNWEY